MLGASRRSVSALARSGVGRYRCLAAPSVADRRTTVPVSKWFARIKDEIILQDHESVIEGDAKVIDVPSRLLSVLSTPPRKCGNTSVADLRVRSNFLLGSRHESTAAAANTTDPPGERFEYQAEVSRLMDLIVHSLYSNKEVFLRELISVTEPGLLKEAVDLDIRIQTDKDNGVITITDTGIGMTRQELVDCLGTIAQSGTAKFLKAVKGEVEFRSIIFVPALSPAGRGDDIANPKTKNIRLYVKRVFISDDFDGELFPRYLSFVKGVVDSNDLPLNVSREILQESRIIRIMRKRLVRKAFDMILGISLSENRDDYDKFWENFGKHLKLGCIEDHSNHKRIAPLLRFFSSQSEEEFISLDEYVENMKPEQKDIYYIAADSLSSAKNTPFLERLIEKDYEVLLLIDPIDEVAIQNLKSYKEKNFVDISKEDLDLGDRNEEKEKEIKQEFGQTCDWIKKRLGDKVASVQISNRLSTSPCVLVSGKFGWSANMERLMKAQTIGDTSSLDFMRSRRVFEINPNHPIIKDLHPTLSSCYLIDMVLSSVNAVLISSSFAPMQPDNPSVLGGKIYEMMGMALSGRWTAPAAEIVEPVHPEGQN
ncbi:hypothetical protein Taro_027454 [Colocasia esculenta]|uniref:Heat shock protein 90 n=1 Tax=Colocasia esculenta TaxID=4460 RepID=A0A843VUC1_COLES|nr:hypothetical protein [Colocasia esculenta]